MRHCPSCGQSISGNERFCPACGYALAQSAPGPVLPTVGETIALTPSRNSRLAIASLICGIIAWILFFIPLLLALPAIVFGHLGQHSVRQGNGLITGHRLALIGMALGYAHLVVTMLGLCVIALGLAFGV